MEIETQIAADALHQVALDEVDAAHPHRRRGLGVFDLLPDHLQAHPVRQIDHPAQLVAQAGIVMGGGIAVGHAQVTERQLGEQCFGFAAGLELAEAELHAGGHQAVAELAQGHRVDQRIVQAQVDDQRSAFDAARGDGLHQPVGEGLARQRTRRLRHEQAQRLAFHLVAGQQVQHAFHHLPVQIDDAPGQFRGRDRLRGRDQGAVGLAHAQEHLVLRQFAAGDRNDGLVGQLQLGVVQRQPGVVRGGHRRSVGGDPLGLHAGLQRRAFGGFQGAAGVGESVRQRRIAHRAGQAQGLFIADDEVALAELFAQAAGEYCLRLGIQVPGQGQETVVVQPGQRMRCGGLGQRASGIGHQVLEVGVAVALAQAQGAADLDEEQAGGSLLFQRDTQLLHQVGAGRQAGFRIDQARRRDHGRALARTLDPVGDRGDQVARTDRFGQEVIGAAFQHFVLALRVRVAGQEYDRQVQQVRTLADLQGQGHAVLPRHVQVHQDQVRPEAFDGRDHPGRCHLHFGQHPGAVQHALREQRLAAVVFHDQDAERGLACILLARIAARCDFGAGAGRGRGCCHRFRAHAGNDRRRIGGEAGPWSGFVGRCIAGPASPVMRRRGFGTQP